MPDRRPNIVFILTDQQRYDSLGCTGHEHALTPNLDNLADQGTVFDRHVTTNPVCMPSRASTMTGCYPTTHGVWVNGVPLGRRERVPVHRDKPGMRQAVEAGLVPAALPTIPDLLADAGYHTRSVGKLHFSPTQSHPDLGFEESDQRWQQDPAMADWHGPYYGFQHVDLTLHHGERVRGHYWHWLQAHHPEAIEAIRKAADQPRPFEGHGDLYPGGHTIQTHPTTWVAETACEFIRSPQAKDQPYFLWVGIPDPHHPFTPPAELAETFEQRPTMPVHARPGEFDPRPSTWPQLGSPSGVAAPAIRRIRQYTDAMVHLIDRGVGRIVEALQETNQWNNTLVIFTSDHGDFLGEFGRIRKGPTACNALNHTPLIARFPDGAQQGLPRRCAAAVSSVDLLPTLCRVAEAQTPDAVHGCDLLTTARQGRSEQQPVLVQAFSPDCNKPRQNFTIYDDRFRYTWHPAVDEHELYDHAADPYELNNLADESNFREHRQRLFDRLVQAHGRFSTPCHSRVACW